VICLLIGLFIDWLVFFCRGWNRDAAQSWCSKCYPRSATENTWQCLYVWV